jgi:large subunit ribosomal protein L28
VQNWHAGPGQVLFSGCPQRAITCVDLFWERTPVAAVCDVCGKRPGFGHNVPWSKKKTNRRWNPNIQRVHAIVSGSPKRLNVCASCIKAGKVTR